MSYQFESHNPHFFKNREKEAETPSDLMDCVFSMLSGLKNL